MAQNRKVIAREIPVHGYALAVDANLPSQLHTVEAVYMHLVNGVMQGVLPRYGSNAANGATMDEVVVAPLRPASSCDVAPVFGAHAGKRRFTWQSWMEKSR